MKIVHAVLAVQVFFIMAAHAQTPVKRVQPNPSALIAAGVWTGDTYYVSGQLPDPVTPADSAKGTPAVYGDMKAQTASVLNKIQALLKDQGLDLKDVVKMTVFIAADPSTGKLDFAGLQSVWAQFFGTPDQPNKPARAAAQVAAMVTPGALLEIDAIAVKSK